MVNLSGLKNLFKGGSKASKATKSGGSLASRLKNVSGKQVVAGLAGTAFAGLVAARLAEGQSLEEAIFDVPADLLDAAIDRGGESADNFFGNIFGDLNINEIILYILGGIIILLMISIVIKRLTK
jgi:hypothetical protein